MANLAGWPYWIVISITGQAGAGTDYQVKLEIGDSAGGDFHLEGHCTNFPQDIRITDDDGTTLLDHFVEDLTADPIVVHVEVKDDLDSNRNIRVYYGKSGESSDSNIDDTFLFGDEFPGSALDGGKWASTTGSSVSGGELSVTAPGGGGSHTANSWHEDVAFRAKVKRLESADGNMIGFVDGWGTDGIMFRVGSSGSNLLQSFGAGLTSVAATSSLIAYETVEIRWVANSVGFFVNDVEESNSPITTNLPAGSVELGIHTTTNRTGYADWVLIRKYNSPEPAFSSAGAEQSAAGAPTGVFYGPLIGPFGGPI